MLFSTLLTVAATIFSTARALPVADDANVSLDSRAVTCRAGFYKVLISIAFPSLVILIKVLYSPALVSA